MYTRACFLCTLANSTICRANGSIEREGGGGYTLAAVRAALVALDNNEEKKYARGGFFFIPRKIVVNWRG